MSNTAAVPVLRQPIHRCCVCDGRIRAYQHPGKPMFWVHTSRPLSETAGHKATPK